MKTMSEIQIHISKQIFNHNHYSQHLVYLSFQNPIVLWDRDSALYNQRE